LEKTTKDFIEQYRQDLEKSRKEAALMDASIPSVDIPPVTSEITEPDHFKEDMVNSFKAVRYRFKEMIDRLEELYMDRYQKYSELYEHVQSEKRQIETLHHIKVNAATFSQLVSSIKKAKIELGKVHDDKAAALHDLEDARTLWKKEEDEFNSLISQREADEQAIIDRMEAKRSELEDEYEERLRRLEQKISEKNTEFEKDLEARRLQLEQEYVEKFQQLTNKEAEYGQIKNQMAALNSEIQDKLLEKEKSVTDSLVLKYGHIIEVNQKEYESELKLKKQRITILDTQLSEQENELKELRAKLAQSDLRAHKLALKVQQYAKEMSKGHPGPSAQKMNVKINEKEVTLQKDEQAKRQEAHARRSEAKRSEQPKIVRPLKERP